MPESVGYTSDVASKGSDRSTQIGQNGDRILVEVIQTVLVFALVLGAMIVIHEFGHFIVAKAFGIRVEVFSVGFGKRLWGIKRGDTDYRIALIPLGGYVKMAGENLDEQVTGAPDEFMSKPKWQRLLVALAGPAANIMTALAIPATMAMIHYQLPAYLNQPAVIASVQLNSAAEKAGLRRGDEIVAIKGVENPSWRDVEDYIAIHPDQDIPVTIRRDGEVMEVPLRVSSFFIEQERIGDAGFEAYEGENARVVVYSVLPGWPADQAGLKPGDQILDVNGIPVEPNARPGSDAVGPALHGRLDLIRTIQTSEGNPVTMKVRRGEEVLTVEATPRADGERLLLGFTPAIADRAMIVTRLSPFAAIRHSYDLNVRILRLTFTVISQIFVGQRSAGETLTGPIGIARMTGQAARQGWESVVGLTAVLSLNLGIFNLLPIPVLDGGLIFMLGLEALLGLFGLTLTLRIKERMMQVGFVILMLLMGFVIFNDISKWIPRSTSSPPAVERQTTPSGR